MSITISPSGNPNSSAREASACRAIAISSSTAPLCRSSGAVSYQLTALAACRRTSPRRRHRDATEFVSTFSHNQQHAALPFTAWPSQGCPVPSAAARSNATNVLPVAHWPLRVRDPLPAPRASPASLSAAAGPDHHVHTAAAGGRIPSRGLLVRELRIRAGACSSWRSSSSSKSFSGSCSRRFVVELGIGRRLRFHRRCCGVAVSRSLLRRRNAHPQSRHHPAPVIGHR